MSASRKRPRSSSPDTDSRQESPSFRQPDPFKAGKTTLNLDDISEQELDAVHFEDDEANDSRFLNIPTIAGLSLIVTGIVYLLTELGVWGGPDLSGIVEALPFIGGILVILLGFGVLNWHPSRRKMSDAQSSASKASDAEQSDEGSSLFGALSPGGKRLQRSRTEKKVAGVCGGIAKYFDLDPTLVRIAFVVGVIASGGPFVVAYAALAFVMPKEPKS